MSHFSQIQKNEVPNASRKLGDEWQDWDGKIEEEIHSGKGLFLTFAVGVILIADFLAILLAYFVQPRLALWHPTLSFTPYILSGAFILITGLGMLQLILTVYLKRNCFFFRQQAYLFFDLMFSRIASLAKLSRISQDRLGHSFVRVSNIITQALKRPKGPEKLLVLLPHCLSKEQLQRIRSLQETYPLEIYTVSGGELARKKVKELRPTAVIGVACERDLVAGIRDVGAKLSVIGLPNLRPEGPCKNTQVDIEELRRAIEFYVGSPH